MTKIIRLIASVTILLTALCVGCNSAFNQSPVISELTASNESVSPGGSSQISCVALDADRDELTYTWEASSGTISGDGATVTWTAPQGSSAYTIKVTVSDGKDETTAEVTVDVLVQGNTAPYIKEVTSVPPPPQFWDDDTITLTCVAIDPDPGDVIVSYVWGVSNTMGKPTGTITPVGNGETATWTAPDVPNKDEFTVSVYCVDSRGNRSRTKFIPFEVWCACIRESGSK